MLLQDYFPIIAIVVIVVDVSGLWGVLKKYRVIRVYFCHYILFCWCFFCEVQVECAWYSRDQFNTINFWEVDYLIYSTADS